MIKYLGIGLCNSRVSKVGEGGQVLCSWSDFKEESAHVKMYENWLVNLIGNGDVMANLNRKPNAHFNKSVNIDDGKSTVELHWIGKGTDPLYVDQISNELEVMYFAVLSSDFHSRNGAQITVDQLLQHFRSNARALGLKSSRTSLEQMLARVADYAGRSKIQDVQKEVGAVTELMHQNMQQVIERQEKLEVLVEKSADLETYSDTFRRQAKTVERRFCFRKYKLTLIAILIIVILLLIVITPLAISLRK